VLNEQALRRAATAAGVSAPVRWDDVTTSTNATAWELATAGAPAWTLVGAGHQTGGRGRGGRSWVDRPGGAVLCSVVLRPHVSPDRVALVALAVGAAMAEAASTIAGREVRCKWPNDLLVDGAKIGGVLCESELAGDRVRHVVAGVGVNLQAPEGVDGAAGLGAVDAEALLSAFLIRLRELVEGAPERIVERWRAVTDTLGRSVEATTVGGDAVRGVAADVADDGALLIDSDGALTRVAFGDVRHLDVNPR
jgi:BirA family biotin operon repressor/biotin-[acetyl-CoA-carboxylase] ligase